jgi:hypothetical protein
MMMDGCPEGLFAKAKVLVVSLQAVQCEATRKKYAREREMGNKRRSVGSSYDIC